LLNVKLVVRHVTSRLYLKTQYREVTDLTVILYEHFSPVVTLKKEAAFSS